MSLKSILITIILPFAIKAYAQDCDTALANHFAGNLFRHKSNLLDSANFRSFNPSKSVTIKTTLLKKLLPNVCFFYAEFNSIYFEYPIVETAVAFNITDSSQSSYTYSPTFADANKLFLNTFLHLKVKDTLDRRILAQEITNIFSAITYKGCIKVLTNTKNNNVVSFELSTDNLRWCIFDFHFNADNILVGINIKNAKKAETQK